MNLFYLPEAREDVLAAVSYYYKCEEGLAAKFYDQLKRAENEIIENPEFWRPMGEGFRRKLLNRFRHGIIYHLLPDDTIEVVAVVHQSSRPNAWKERIS